MTRCHKQPKLQRLTPQGILPPTDFWQSPTIEELAQSQGIHPVRDVRAFFGTWPGEKDDGFEEDIEKLRQANLARFCEGCC